jgi:hypothetical protein
MTDWIEHTTDTCPVDPETVVEVRMSPKGLCYWARAGDLYWDIPRWSHYRIITPAKPPEPEGKEIDPSGTQMWIKRQPDLITLRLECLKLAATLDMAQILGAHLTFEQVADIFLHYVLNGSVDKA